MKEKEKRRKEGGQKKEREGKMERGKRRKEDPLHYKMFLTSEKHLEQQTKN